jgi:hypothetical protein
MNTIKHKQTLGLALATLSSALALALALAGCGGSTKPSTTGTSGPGGNKSNPPAYSKSQLAAAACIRKHGVPDFPDPTFGAGGAQVNLSTPPGMLTSPGFMLAQQECAKLGLELAGYAASHQSSAAQAAEALAIAKCMRAHGVPNWPDATTHIPNDVNAEGYGVMGAVPNSGLVFLIPKSIDIEAPAVKRAATACHEN